MSKQVQIGSDIYVIPDAGDNPGWGEDLTKYLEAIADALTEVQGPNDILVTSATLANNQLVAANIPGLLFNVSEVQGIEVDCFIIRTYDSGISVATERIKILGDYNGSAFSISQESSNDTGVVISVDNSGQFKYTSSDLPNHISSVIRFRAKTIDTP
jgi:hypothetical protein